MGKTLRKFSNKEKKTKRKRSYKKGGDKKAAWVTAVEELDGKTYSFKTEIMNNNDVGKLETTYNELERYLKEPKKSCREKELLFGRAPLIGDTKNERCEVHKYAIYYRLHAFLVKQNDPNENIKEIKKRVLELIKQKMNIRVNQAFNYINNIVLDRDYKEIFHDDIFRSVLTDKDNFNRLNEDKQRYLNRVIKKEEITEDGYIEIDDNLDKFIEAKLNFEYILLNKDNTITKLGKVVDKKQIKQDLARPKLGADWGNNFGYDVPKDFEYIFTEKTIKKSDMSGTTIFYKNPTEVYKYRNGGKKKYKKNRKTARRGRKTGGDPNAWRTVAVGVENAVNEIKNGENKKAVNELDSLLKDKSTLFDWSGSCSGDIKCELQKSHNYAKAKILAELLDEPILANELNNKIARKKANNAVSTDVAFEEEKIKELQQKIAKNKQQNMQKVTKPVQKSSKPEYLSVKKDEIEKKGLAAYLKTTYGDNFKQLMVNETAMSCHSDATGGSNYNYFAAFKDGWKYTLCDVIDISGGKGQLTGVFKIQVQQGQAANATIKVPKTRDELLNPSTIRS